MMEIVLKLDSKEAARVVAALNRLISDDEYILRGNGITLSNRENIENHLAECETLRKKILNATYKQTLQNTTKQDSAKKENVAAKNITASADKSKKGLAKNADNKA